MKRTTEILRRRTPRRLVLLALIASAVPLVIPHLGAGGQKAVNNPPRIMLDEAELIATVSTSSGPVQLFAAPTDDGRECVTTSLADVTPASAGVEGRANGGAECAPAQDVTRPLATPSLTTAMSWSPAASGVALVIEGRAAPSIRRVELVLSDGSVVPAGLGQPPFGYYVSRLSTSAVGQLPGKVDVVGYDGAGREVARLDLQRVLVAATPH